MFYKNFQIFMSRIPLLARNHNLFLNDLYLFESKRRYPKVDPFQLNKSAQSL